MTGDRFLELAPLFALDALDGDDLVQFREHLAACADCQRELRAHEDVASRLGTAAAPMPLPPGLRARALAAAGVPRPARAAPWLPALAAAGLGALALVTHLDRNAARREAEEAAAEAERARGEISAVRRDLAEKDALVALLAHPDTRLTLLAGGPPAGHEPSGRVLWNAKTRRAVLLAEGLPPAPSGKAYEVWVIAEGAPRAAGIFRPDSEGRAVFTLPEVAETARARTFAVTLEPEGGVAAPSGPMVLAGAVS